METCISSGQNTKQNSMKYISSRISSDTANVYAEDYRLATKELRENQARLHKEGRGPGSSLHTHTHQNSTINTQNIPEPDQISSKHLHVTRQDKISQMTSYPLHRKYIIIRKMVAPQHIYTSQIQYSGRLLFPVRIAKFIWSTHTY